LAFKNCITISSKVYVSSICCSNHLGTMMTVDIFQYKWSAVLLKCGVWSWYHTIVLSLELYKHSGVQSE
jgi:hypothetical protein